MKYVALIFSTLLAMHALASGQMSLQPDPAQERSLVSGGLGISWIDGTPYYMIGVLPDLSFGKLGIGLDLTLRMSGIDGTIRRVDWADGTYRKIIRYLRWGEKHEPIYADVGQLEVTTVGHGFIMYDYTNSPSFDNRTVGCEFDLNLSQFGFESLYGDFHEPGVEGGRLYIRPLRLIGLTEVPFIGGLELGATYMRDQNRNSGIVLVQGPEARELASYVPEDLGRLSEYGFDTSIPLARAKDLDADFYYEYARIIRFGHGSGVGITGTFRGFGPLTMSAELERQFAGARFIPEYFDHFYELERFSQYDSSTLVGKAQALGTTIASQGWFGQLTLSLTRKFRITGSFRTVNNNPAGSLLHLEARFPQLIPEIVLNASYDRAGLVSLSNLFNLDDKSLFFAFFGYRPYPFMTIGLDYFWTYSLVNHTYVVQRRVEPSVMVNFYF